MIAKVVSIVVNNCNYARYLPHAIDSALNQEYPHKEVIVVDDGSTDGSREIISNYGGRVRAVLKANGGQSSAFNAGCAASRGEFVLFLDADDVLMPHAVSSAVEQFARPGVIKVHWPLTVIDFDGAPTGARKPPQSPRSGRLLDLLEEFGPAHASWPPTSGNAWRRSFLQRVFPIPEIEREFSVGSASADWYLSMLAPLFGDTAAIDEPLSCYRVHGRNDYTSMEFARRIARDVRMFDYRSQVLRRYCRECNVAVNPARWERNSWAHRLAAATRELDQFIPPSEQYVLIDDAVLGVPKSAQHRPIGFVERDGHYWGPPRDDRQAIDELERLRAAGARFLAIAWPSFWWLEHFPGFARHLRSHAPELLHNDRLIIFDLHGENGENGANGAV